MSFYPVLGQVLISMMLLLVGCQPAGQGPGPVTAVKAPAEQECRQTATHGVVMQDFEAGRLARPDESLPKLVCEWLAAMGDGRILYPVFASGKAYVIASPGAGNEMRISALSREGDAVVVTFDLKKGGPGKAAIIVLSGTWTEKVWVRREPVSTDAWVDTIVNSHRLPPGPLPPDGGAAFVDVTPAAKEVRVRGFTRSNERLIQIRVRDGAGEVLGTVEQEAGGGKGDWGSFVLNVPLTQTPRQKEAWVEIRTLSLKHNDFLTAASLPVLLPADAKAPTLTPRPWSAKDLTLAGVPLRSHLEAAETLHGPGNWAGSGTLTSIGGKFQAEFAYPPNYGAAAHRLVARVGSTVGGVAVLQSEADVVKRLGQPDTRDAAARVWSYLSPETQAELRVTFDAAGKVSELELRSYFPAPQGTAAAPPLTEELALQLLKRYQQADWFERSEALTTGKASAHWRRTIEYYKDGHYSPKAEDWTLDGARLRLSPETKGILSMSYQSNFLSKQVEMEWKFEAVAGEWRIADWKLYGAWLP